MKTKGRCAGCKKQFSSAGGSRHLFSCTSLSQPLQASSTTASGYLLKVSFAEAPSMFWMFLTIPAKKTLDLLDSFLREIWLECCNHISMFTIGGKDYHSYPYEEDLSMNARVKEIFYPNLTFDYVYDFGSSTNLKIKVINRIKKCPQGQIMLLMRNEFPPLDCELCEKTADTICSLCGETICQSCSTHHSCEQEEDESYIMPLVNSPRTGVCGYY